jgi:hypothetical protein
MDIEDLRKLRLADPFKPFRVVLLNGRELVVDRSFYLAFSPTNDLLLFSTLAGEFVKFGIQHVKEATLLEAPKDRAGGKST